MLKRLYGTTMFFSGAFVGWVICVAMAAWAGKNIEKLVEQQLAKDLKKHPIRLTED